MDEQQFPLEPLHDRIIIKKVDLEAKTESGIILGEVEKDRETAYGEVYAVGDGKQLDTSGVIPTKVKVGDLIGFNERIPLRVGFKGEYYYCLRESDVYFIVRDKNVSVKPYVTEGYEYDKNITKM